MPDLVLFNQRLYDASVAGGELNGKRSRVALGGNSDGEAGEELIAEC